LSPALLALFLVAQAPLVDLGHFLENYAGLDEDVIRAVRDGRIVAKLLPSSDGREIAAFGIAKVAFSAEFFRGQFRNVETFKRSYSVPEVGRFGDPPRLADVDALSVPREDVKDLRRCRPGDCKLRLSSDFIARMHQAIDWTLPDAEERAESLFKEMLLERAMAYHEGGSRELEAYDDKDAVIPLRKDFEAILNASAYLLDYVPELANFLRRYPNPALEGAESFLYWSKEDFGLKPVISMTHAVLYLWRHGDEEEELIVASKQFYASHYFDSSLGLTAVFEVEEGESEGRYLVYINRSRSLDLGGFFGRIKRSLLAGRIRDGLRKNLLHTRARLDAIYRASEGVAR
jgi:hypothetical protein